MRYARMIGCVVVALLLVSTLPYAAGAAAIRVKPHKFNPCKARDGNNHVMPVYIQGDGGQAQHYALVNLPVGRTITKLTLFYSGPGTDLTTATLNRVRLGEQFQLVAAINAISNTGTDVWSIQQTSIDRPLIESGFTYYVWVEAGTNARVWGVKINYE